MENTIFESFGVVIPLMFPVPSAPPQNLTLEVRNSKVRLEDFLLAVGKKKVWEVLDWPHFGAALGLFPSVQLLSSL